MLYSNVEETDLNILCLLTSIRLNFTNFLLAVYFWFLVRTKQYYSAIDGSFFTTRSQSRVEARWALTQWLGAAVAHLIAHSEGSGFGPWPRTLTLGSTWTEPTQYHRQSQYKCPGTRRLHCLNTSKKTRRNQCNRSTFENSVFIQINAKIGDHFLICKSNEISRR